MNLTEKMIEAAFCKWLPTRGIHVLKRQAMLPVGRLDVVAIGQSSVTPYVVEVKKGKAPASAFTQLMGYVHFLEYAITWEMSGLCHLESISGLGQPSGILVAESFDEMTLRAWRKGWACNLVTYQFDGLTITFSWLDEQSVAGDMHGLAKPDWFQEILRRLGQEYAKEAEGRIGRLAAGRDGGNNALLEPYELSQSIPYWRKGAR